MEPLVPNAADVRWACCSGGTSRRWGGSPGVSRLGTGGSTAIQSATGTRGTAHKRALGYASLRSLHLRSTALAPRPRDLDFVGQTHQSVNDFLIGRVRHLDDGGVEDAIPGVVGIGAGTATDIEGVLARLQFQPEANLHQARAPFRQFCHESPGHAQACREDHLAVAVAQLATGTDRPDLASRFDEQDGDGPCLLYTSPSPRDRQKSRLSRFETWRRKLLRFGLLGRLFDRRRRQLGCHRRLRQRLIRQGR